MSLFKKKKEKISNEKKNSDNNLIEIKILFLGDEMVGKTSLYRRLTDGSSNENQFTTIDKIIIILMI